MRHLAVLLIGVAVLGTGEATGGEVVRKWRTPEGTLYFGERPPPGSEPLGAVGELETTGAAVEDSAEPAREETAREAARIREERASRRRAKRERREALARAVEIGPHSVTRGNFHWIVVGVVRNRAGEAVHAVEVGAGGTWTSAEPPTIPGGGEATFRLEVPIFPIEAEDRLPPLELRWREQ